jgi:hypothetical protein
MTASYVSEEPGAVTPHAGICGGESQRWLSYPTKPQARICEGEAEWLSYSTVGGSSRCTSNPTGNRRRCVSASKPFVIPKLLVFEAWKAVKANAGSAGVDKETIDDFELELKSNLYRIWNRMSSGSYFPTPVKAVAILKKNGGERILGIPTVAGG